MKMTRIILPVLILLSSFHAFGQDPNKLKELQALGLIYIGYPYRYLSETELSNSQYAEYINWLKEHSDSLTVQEALPDTLAWKKELAYSEPLVNYYFSHPAYYDYPAVNISQQQARNYCKWLQDRINEQLNLAKKTEIDSVIVRLPMEKEWMDAARIGLPDNWPYPWNSTGIRRMQDKKCRGCIRLNIKRSTDDYGGVAGNLNDNGLITTPVKAYWPSPGGFWHMSGNVSEWVDESGKSKGGSWNQGAYRARIDQPGYHDGDSSANPEIGFRYLVEIVAFKPEQEVRRFEFDKKQFRETFVPFRDSLYAQVTELTNYEYQQFLLENPDPEYRIHTENWTDITRYSYILQYGNPALFREYPVVNISYDAARAYCAWLTEKYASWEKRPYKKVVFRLPTPEEWELAARGNREGSRYPWGGPYTQNSNGHYIANFCPLEDQYFDRNDSGKHFYNYPDNDFSISRPADGVTFLGKVFYYFPNDFGYYNMAGNAAEMTSEEGICRGGSWDSNQDEIQVDHTGYYSAPNPMLGFRVFMEVIEY